VVGDRGGGAHGERPVALEQQRRPIRPGVLDRQAEHLGDDAVDLDLA
jgi:hypothetical protein